MHNETQKPTYICPVCQTDAVKLHTDRIGNEFSSEYNCPRCGIYWIEDFFSRNSFPHILGGDKRKIAVLSHWIRTRHEVISKEPPSASGGRHFINLNEQLVNSIIKNSPPTPAQQADKFVLWLGNNSKKYPPGEIVNVCSYDHQSIMGAITPKGFALVLNDLIDTGILQGYKTSDGSDRSGYGGGVTLSLKGWSHYEKLKRGATDSRKAFMAMQYGEETLDKIVNNFFRDAVKQTGFDLFLLYERPKAGLIDDRLRVEIQTSRFLIADLTHDNLGAYWEAGYAEGLGKPVIYTCEKSKFEKDPTHFDTNHHLTIPWDAENPQEATKKLKDTIRATLPDAAKLTDD